MSRSNIRPALLSLLVAGAGPLAVVACGPPGAPATPPTGPSAKPSTSASAGAGKAPTHRAASESPSGEVASINGTQVKISSPAGGDRYMDAISLHPVPGDRGLLKISPTALLYLDSGTLLVGMGDGTVSAVDAAGHTRFSLGFRGSIAGLVQAGPDSAVLTTGLGVMALVTGNGKVTWERQVTAEPLGKAVIARDGSLLAASQRGVFAFSPAGALVFSHASALLQASCARDDYGCDKDKLPTLAIEGDEVVAGEGLRFRLTDAHPAVPSLVPTFPLTFRRVLEESILSIVATGATEVSVLSTKRKPRSEYEWDTDDRYDVVQIDGSKTTRTGVPERASKKEDFVEGGVKEQAAVFVDALVLGPNGNPWVLARKMSSKLTGTEDSLLGRWGGAGQIFEVSGGKIRERNDLFKEFHDHWLSIGIAAAPEGKASLFCYGYDDVDCAAYDGATFHTLTPNVQVASIRRVGDAFWVLSTEGGIDRTSAGKPENFETVPQDDGLFFVGIAGVSEKDVWADSRKRYVAMRFDGTTWKEVPVPVVGKGWSARATDDVWNGRSHWDGKGWSLAYRAPPATAALAKSKDDVWLGDAIGLWHGTSPGPSPVTLPQLPPAADAAPAASQIALGAPDTRYAVERPSIDVAGGAPLKIAKNVTVSPDGVLWFLDWDRVVEVDTSGKATIVRTQGRESVGKWAYPFAKGRGAVLERDDSHGIDKRDEVRKIDGVQVTSEEVQLDRQDTMAVHAHPQGATWVVGAPSLLRPVVDPRRSDRDSPMTAWEEFSPHALVRDGKDAAFRPVLGLPAASWCDVAATADGGAFFVGGLSNGPSGEGILVHAKGRLGSEAVSRVRAASTLLAVAAVGPDEAWAVGAGGTVVHVQGSTVSRFVLPSGEWLRAVLAVAPNDVWVGGEGGTLLHYDGTSFHPIQTPLGAHAAFTGIAAARGQIWVASPSGILRLVKRP